MEPARRWSIVVLLCLGMVIAYIDRTSLSIAIAVPEFRTFFSLTDSQRGLMNSAFFWSYALLQVPAGWMVDRLGVKYPYALSFLFWSAIAAITGQASSLWQLFALRLLLGAGEATVAPASLRWIRMNIGENQRGLAMGIYMAGTKIGPAIGAPVAAWLIAHYGWRSMFLMTGLMGIFWLVPWMILVPRDETAQPTTSKTAASDAPFWSLFKSPAIWGILIGTFAYSCYLYYSLTWLPSYFKEQRHLPLEMMGIFTMFSFSGMAVTAIASGWAADLVIKRGGDALKVRRGFTMAGLVLAATEVLGANAASDGWALFFAIFSLAGLGVATANYWALTQTVVPGGAIGRIGGLQNTASNLAGVAAPILTGWLIQKTGNYEAPMQAIAVLLLIGAASYALLVKRESSR
ncbi:MAG TPA: MFS transporter [Bryobacteraceae bacterium]|nr:MFS transporter [Bryobacteraceae bacterium]